MGIVVNELSGIYSTYREHRKTVPEPDLLEGGTKMRVSASIDQDGRD
jgi:hypothetical protein